MSIDVAFTAHMEDRAGRGRGGQGTDWKAVLRDILRRASTRRWSAAEAALEGVRIKVPEEETDEVCELCGRKMVIKSGRFGRFLACPGYPGVQEYEAAGRAICRGRCPKCGSGMLEAQNRRKGYVYLRLRTRGVDCGFMSWDVPTASWTARRAGRRCSKSRAEAI